MWLAAVHHICIPMQLASVLQLPVMHHVDPDCASPSTRVDPAAAGLLPSVGQDLAGCGDHLGAAVDRQPWQYQRCRRQLLGALAPRCKRGW